MKTVLGIVLRKERFWEPIFFDPITISYFFNSFSALGIKFKSVLKSISWEIILLYFANFTAFLKTVPTPFSRMEMTFIFLYFFANWFAILSVLSVEPLLQRNISHSRFFSSKNSINLSVFLPIMDSSLYAGMIIEIAPIITGIKYIKKVYK